MRITIFLILFGTAISICAAPSILVYDFKATGLESSTTEAVRELFRSDLTEYGYAVRTATSGEICTDAACAANGARGAGTELVLYGSLAKLGDKIIVNIYVADSSGNIVHTDKLNSETVEDLDVVVERLTRGIAEGKKAGEVIDKTNITDAETQEPRRRKNFYTIGAKIGYRLPLGSSYGKEDMWQYEAVGMYEMEKFFVEGKGYGTSGGDAVAFGLGVGIYYIFSPRDFTPYAGVSAGIEWIMEMPYYYEETDSIAGGASGDGPAISLGGGLMMFQTYDFRVMLDVKYSMVFVGEADIDWDYGFGEDGNKKDLGIENSISIMIGITRRDIGGERSTGLCCMPW